MRDDNYGMQEEWERSSVPAPNPMSPADERSWSALAHLSTFLNLFTGFLGPVAALVVWLVYKDRSSMVGRHAMRSVVYQILWLAGLSIGWTVTFFLTAFFVGVLLWPVMIVLTLAFFAQASYEAYQVYRGGDRGFL